MGFYRVNGGIAGKPGVGLYDVSEEAFRACCCKGLRVGSISFVTIGSPDCDIVAQGSPEITCVYGDNSVDAALSLAIGYIGELNYITKCRPTTLNPDPETNFCQNKIPVFTYKSAEETGSGYSFSFDVEDCGIAPIDYEATITVNRC
jgi:hypothetical protein